MDLLEKDKQYSNLTDQKSNELKPLRNIQTTYYIIFAILTPFIGSSFILLLWTDKLQVARRMTAIGFIFLIIVFVIMYIVASININEKNKEKDYIDSLIDKNLNELEQRLGLSEHINVLIFLAKNNL